MKDSNLRFPRSKQGGIAASPMRDKTGHCGVRRNTHSHLLARFAQYPPHTVIKMVPPTRIELVMTGYQPIVIPFNYRGIYWCVCMESNHNPRLRRPVYYPLYYRRKIGVPCRDRTCFIGFSDRCYDHIS